MVHVEGHTTLHGTSEEPHTHHETLASKDYDDNHALHQHSGTVWWSYLEHTCPMQASLGRRLLDQRQLE